MTEMTVRPARPQEAEALTALCRRAKAHWGYDTDFMARSAASLTISRALIESGLVLVAEGENAGLLGMASLDPLKDKVWDLLHMFVEPAAIGTGVGRILFARIAALAQTKGGTRLSILSDPHAEGFYLRLGARRAGEAPSDSISGRMLPLLEYDLDALKF